MFDFILTELGVKGDLCIILETHCKYVKDFGKLYENEFDSRYENYREIDQKDRAKDFRNKLSKLKIHGNVQKIDFKNVGIEHDATTSYISAMWDDDSKYFKI